MDKLDWDVVDPARSKLRALAAALEERMRALRAAEGAGELPQISGVMSAWEALSKALALGEEPELRSCPHCSRRVPIRATRCRYCMKHSPAIERSAEP